MGIIEPGLRSKFREAQIKAITAETKKEYAERIRAAPNRSEKRKIKAERDALIAERIAPLVRERKPLPPAGHCYGCGYNLRGNVSGRCPECGNALEVEG